MPDLQALLDQIDRLDQQATKTPWVTDQHWAEIASGPDSVIHGYGYAHCEGCDEEVESVDSRVALSPEDAEFIALARDAMPNLAKALSAVIESCEETIRSVDKNLLPDERDHANRDHADMVLDAITDALEIRDA